jgi:branched-chain amino acid transport system ATP-binding protein
MTPPLLEIRDLVVRYGTVPAVNGVSLDVYPGEMRVILGANGAGKSTILKAVLGLQRARAGSIRLDQTHDLLALKPHQIHRLGVAWVPEGRRLWNTMTVLDNLKMGGEALDKQTLRTRIGEAFERYPRLRERQGQIAGLLSGGEQQMVALARSLISRPRLVLMDEPSLGLAPIVVRDIFAMTKQINALGISVLMVEQNARQALKAASFAYLLELGRIVSAGPCADIANLDSVKAVFLGGAA